VSAGRIPRDHTPARRGEARYLATKTQKPRIISNCDTLPNYVLPLARFGGASLTYKLSALMCLT
jgi:hypothetical protein